MSKFTDRLIFLKQEKKLLQKNIAEEINISLRAYQRYEKGEREPTMSTLILLADLFGVSLDFLVGRTDNSDINK